MTVPRRVWFYAEGAGVALQLLAIGVGLQGNLIVGVLVCVFASPWWLFATIPACLALAIGIGEVGKRVSNWADEKAHGQVVLQ